MSISYFEDTIRLLKKLKESESIEVDPVFKAQLREKFLEGAVLNKVSESRWGSRLVEWLEKWKYLIGLVPTFGVLALVLVNVWNIDLKFRSDVITEIPNDIVLVEEKLGGREVDEGEAEQKNEESSEFKVFSACEVLPERFKECGGSVKDEVLENSVFGSEIVKTEKVEEVKSGEVSKDYLFEEKGVVEEPFVKEVMVEEKVVNKVVVDLGKFSDKNAGVKSEVVRSDGFSGLVVKEDIVEVEKESGEAEEKWENEKKGEEVGEVRVSDEEIKVRDEEGLGGETIKVENEVKELKVDEMEVLIGGVKVGEGNLEVVKKIEDVVNVFAPSFQVVNFLMENKTVNLEKEEKVDEEFELVEMERGVVKFFKGFSEKEKEFVLNFLKDGIDFVDGKEFLVVKDKGFYLIEVFGEGARKLKNFKLKILDEVEKLVLPPKN